ncbi:unnamed protein product, partial [Ilex paraguariensis]
MKNIHLKDLPSFIRTIGPNDIMFNFTMTEAEKVHKASALILNTFDALEHEVLEALSTIFFTVYTIRPLQLHLNQIKEDDMKTFESNLC